MPRVGEQDRLGRAEAASLALSTAPTMRTPDPSPRRLHTQDSLAWGLRTPALGAARAQHKYPVVPLAPFLQ